MLLWTLATLAALLGYGGAQTKCSDEWEERLCGKGGPDCCIELRVAFAFDPRLQKAVPAPQEWRAGLQFFQDNTNDKNKGLLLGNNKKGYLNISGKEITRSDTAGYVNAYRDLCNDESVSVLLTPFSASGETVSTVLELLNARSVCQRRIPILAAGGAERGVQYNNHVWSIYSRDETWASGAISHLYGAGARTFAIAGDQRVSGTEGIFEGALSTQIDMSLRIDA